MMEIGKKYFDEEWRYLLDLDEEEKQAWQIIWDAWFKSDEIIGYNPHLRVKTFVKECEKLPANYDYNYVAEHTGITEFWLRKNS